MAGRRFLVTGNGFLGLAPPKTQEGDKIALVWGARTPTILRPRQDGKYLVIGSCYVQGMMFGEMADRARAQNEMIDLV